MRWRWLRWAAVVATGAITTAAVAGARDDDDDEESRNRLAGTWEVIVDRPAPLPDLKSLQVYTRSGSSVEMANEPQATRTAAYGVYERISGRRYEATMTFFRFNDQNHFIGSTKVNRTITLGRDGDSFTHVGTATLLDANDNVVTTFNVSASGVRMEVERIPEQP